MMKQILAATLLLSASIAQADIYHFAQINPNSNGLEFNPLGAQLTMEVTSAGSNSVNFKFTNPVGIASSIIGIYFGVFEGGVTPVNSISLTSSNGVSFIDNTGGVFPQQGSVNFTSLYSAEASGNGQANKVPNGINAFGDNVVFTATTDLTFSAFIAALNSTPGSGVGLTVKDTSGGDNGGLDRYLTATPSAVPVPAALPLMASALGMFGIARRRKQAN